MKIALLCYGSPFDKRSWSGIPYHARRELERRFEVHVLDTPRLDVVVDKAARLARLGVLPAREPLVLALLARLLRPRMQALAPDAIISINAVHKVSAFAADWPCVVFSDGMFGPMIDYYPQFRRLSPRVRRNGDAQQRALIARGCALVLASDWAARASAAYYGAPMSRFVVAPMGPGFDSAPEAPPPRSNAGPLRLLFVGYDWERKGGPIVARVFRLLRRSHPDAQLHIVGCRPDDAAGMAGVTCHGRLDKSDPAGAATLESLFREASFFFMPSRQEAFGVVHVEACAFGLPPVAADTGGVGTIVRDGVNGLLMPADADDDAYAAAIAGVWADSGRYEAMQRAARRAFEDRLNWRAWGDAMEAQIRRVAGG